MKPFTICALTFGDELERIKRCLSSLARALPDDVRVVEDFRIALNHCTQRVDDWVSLWAREMTGDPLRPTPVMIYRTDKNYFKYPIMRRMLREPHLGAPYVMWLDDDSYFEDPLAKDFWARLLAKIANHDMVGQIWSMPIQGSQWRWIQDQPWYNPSVGMPKKVRGKHSFEFCQGAWWVARTEMLLKYDWPQAEIRHNGGDSMLGELMRHQGLRMGRFISGSNDKHDGVRINADHVGRHSKAKRRGHDENRVGWNYEGKPLDTSHQQFAIEIESVPMPEPQNPEIVNLFKR